MATHPVQIRLADDVLELVLPPGVSGYELVNGELVEVSPVGPVHGELALMLGARLLEHVLQNKVDGRAFVEAGFVLGLRRDPERLRGPDISFVSGERLRKHGKLETRRFFRFAPDLAIEIESRERPKELQQRIQDYLDAGTSLVWVIHTETRSATVYRADGSARLLREADTLEGEDVLPGFEVPLPYLFSR